VPGVSTPSLYVKHHQGCSGADLFVNQIRRFRLSPPGRVEERAWLTISCARPEWLFQTLNLLLAKQPGLCRGPTRRSARRSTLAHEVNRSS
jgi:hypothetical protein